MSRFRSPIRVRVAFDWNAPASRDLLAGVLDVARTRPWRLTDAPNADAVIHDGSGAGMPQGPLIVLVTMQFKPADVRPDQDAVGTLAAAHFLDRGFRHVARAVSAPGAAAFEAAITAAGRKSPTELEDDCDFTGLPKPLAVYAVDAKGLLCLAQQAGRRVPEDVAILGVGNDPAVCELADPPLSSIDLGPRQLGRRAALRLERLLKRKPVSAAELVPPVTVVVRVSTDTLAIDDAEVIGAVRFIREHAAGPLRVGDLVRAVDLDRRTLERRFRKALGRSPAEVLRRHRVERSADLLRTTQRPVTEIAHATGFRLPQHLAAAFRAIVGQTPSDYRASHAVEPSAQR